MTTLRSGRVLLLLLLTACSQASSSLDPGKQAVEEIRGLKFTEQVKVASIDRSELSHHLRRQMEQSVPYSLEDWGTVLRALQLVDAEPSSIVPRMLDLYESQVLAFYDPHSHTYYSIKQMPKLPEETAKLVDAKTLEETVMVHELMHALQDQHFRLSSREKALMRDTDASLAYHSVLEGEAVLVMIAHMLGKSGVSLDEVVKSDDLLSMVSTAAQAEQMIDPDTPKYFVDMLKFPYLEGLKFVVAAYRQGGWAAIDRVHANPPRSTREILDPAVYFARSFQAPPFDDRKPAGPVIAVEHLGAFHWRFLVGDASSRGWVNDRAVVWRDGRVEANTRWETEENAATFAKAYEAFLTGRGLTPVIRQNGTEVLASYVTK